MTLGFIIVDTWAGRSVHAVDILRETEKSYRIRWRSQPCARISVGHVQFIRKQNVRSEAPSWATGERRPLGIE